MKIILDSKACSPVIQILRKYSTFCYLPFFTYLKLIAEAVPFYQNLIFLFLDIILPLLIQFMQLQSRDPHLQRAGGYLRLVKFFYISFMFLYFNFFITHTNIYGETDSTFPCQGFMLVVSLWCSLRGFVEQFLSTPFTCFPLNFFQPP